LRAGAWLGADSGALERVELEVGEANLHLPLRGRAAQAEAEPDRAPAPAKGGVLNPLHFLAVDEEAQRLAPDFQAEEILLTPSLDRARGLADPRRHYRSDEVAAEPGPDPCPVGGIGTGRVTEPIAPLLGRARGPGPDLDGKVGLDLDGGG